MTGHDELKAVGLTIGDAAEVAARGRGEAAVKAAVEAER